MREDLKDISPELLQQSDTVSNIGSVAVESYIKDSDILSETLNKYELVESDLPEGELKDMLLSGLEAVKEYPIEDELGVDESADEFDWDALSSEHDENIIDRGVEINLEDDLFVFKTALDGLAEKPDDIHYASALEQSFNNIMSSGIRDEMIYAARMLAEHVCNHAIENGINSNSLSESSLAEKDKENEADDHEPGCEGSSSSGKKCTCKSKTK